MSLNHSLLFVILLLSSSSTLQAQTACTITITGNETGEFTLEAGDKLCLAPGANFTGTARIYGGELLNNATAAQSFNVTFSTQYPGGTITNNGEMNFSSSWTQTESTTFINNGTVNVNGLFTARQGAIFNNNDTLKTNSMRIESNGTLNNNKVVNVTSSVLVNNNSEINNYSDGKFTCEDINFESSGYNAGSIIVNDFFEIRTNSNLIIDGGCITSGRAHITGTINGTLCGTITVAGNSTLQGDGVLSGYLAFVDQSPPSSAPFIDVTGGTIGPNVQWESCGCPGPPATENCSNTLDDDGDCLIDCDDPDCGPTLWRNEINEPIDYAIGQQALYTSVPVFTDNRFINPRDMEQDPTTGKVFVCDAGNNRIMRFASVDDLIMKRPAEAILGQPDFNTRTSGLSDSKQRLKHSNRFCSRWGSRAT